jgi:hypothetical protein
VALLGALSRHLPFSVEAWTAALKRNLPEKLHEANLQAFSMGRAIGPEEDEFSSGNRSPTVIPPARRITRRCEQLRELQLQRLQAVVARAWQQVELFRSRMEERGLAPQDIRSLEDIASCRSP